MTLAGDDRMLVSGALNGEVRVFDRFMSNRPLLSTNVGSSVYSVVIRNSTLCVGNRDGDVVLYDFTNTVQGCDWVHTCTLDP